MLCLTVRQLLSVDLAERERGPGTPVEGQRAHVSGTALAMAASCLMRQSPMHFPMDQARNPCRPGAGTRPLPLVGCYRELDAMDVARRQPLLGIDAALLREPTAAFGISRPKFMSYLTRRMDRNVAH